MSDFNLVRESIQVVRDYEVLETTYENGASQRRQVHEEVIVGFNISSPDCTQAQYMAYQNFYDSVNGSLDSFTFTSPFDNVEYTVKFKRKSFKATYKKGLFKVTFAFEVV